MHRVAWLPGALDELAAIWTSASSGLRKAITVAAHQIEQVLQRDPQDFGESRAGTKRIGFQEPLGLTFTTDEAQHVVWILHVWNIRRDPNNE